MSKAPREVKNPTVSEVKASIIEGHAFDKHSGNSDNPKFQGRAEEFKSAGHDIQTKDDLQKLLDKAMKDPNAEVVTVTRSFDNGKPDKVQTFIKSPETGCFINLNAGKNNADFGSIYTPINKAAISTETGEVVKFNSKDAAQFSILDENGKSSKLDKEYASKVNDATKPMGVDPKFIKVETGHGPEAIHEHLQKFANAQDLNNANVPGMAKIKAQIEAPNVQNRVLKIDTTSPAPDAPHIKADTPNVSKVTNSIKSGAMAIAAPAAAAAGVLVAGGTPSNAMAAAGESIAPETMAAINAELSGTEIARVGAIEAGKAANMGLACAMAAKAFAPAYAAGPVTGVLVQTGACIVAAGMTNEFHDMAQKFSPQEVIEKIKSYFEQNPDVKTSDIKNMGQFIEGIQNNDQQALTQCLKDDDPAITVHESKQSYGGEIKTVSNDPSSGGAVPNTITQDPGVQVQSFDNSGQEVDPNKPDPSTPDPNAAAPVQNQVQAPQLDEHSPNMAMR